jgi:hypothetical protein
MTQADMVAAGKKAFAKRLANGEIAWEEWEEVIKALKVGRDKAMRVAGLHQGDKPAGKKYSNAMNEWLVDNEWTPNDGGPWPTTRAACLK